MGIKQDGLVSGNRELLIYLLKFLFYVSLDPRFFILLDAKSKMKKLMTQNNNNNNDNKKTVIQFR